MISMPFSPMLGRPAKSSMTSAAVRPRCARIWVAAVVVLAAAACSKTDDEPEATAKAAVRSPVEIDAAGCPDDPTTGISDTTIKVGLTTPQTGLFGVYEAISQGIGAYFDMVNAEGGVGGRRLELVTKDDQMRASSTKQNVRSFVESGDIFAMVGTWATDNNLAVREIVNQGCIPNVAMGTSAIQFQETDRYQWEMPGLLSASAEMAAAMTYIKSVDPEATVGLVADRGADGTSYAKAFASAIERSDLKTVAIESFDPIATLDAAPQVDRLVKAGAGWVVLAVGGKACPATIALAAVDATFVIAGSCAPATIISQAEEKAKGVISIRSSVDPNAVSSAGDPAVEAFVEAVADGDSTARIVTDGIAEIGWNQAAMFVKGLEGATPLDRVSFMTEMHRLAAADSAWSGVGLLAGGDPTGVEDPWPLDTAFAAEWSGTAWEPVGAQKMTE